MYTVGTYLKDSNNPHWLGLVTEIDHEGEYIVAGVEVDRQEGTWTIWSEADRPASVSVQDDPTRDPHLQVKLQAFVVADRRERKLRERTLAPPLRPAGVFGRVEHAPQPEPEQKDPNVPPEPYRVEFMSDKPTPVIRQVNIKPPEFSPYEMVLIRTKGADAEKSLWERGWLVCQLDNKNWVVEIYQGDEVKEMFEVEPENVFKLPHVSWWKRLWHPI